ncbi:MAG: DUF4154 domain-containing protein, partial [Bacteroidales bacterium]|nr:DUF4154 domain-containing protein [Bacteroidales bacterium]
MRFLFVLVMMTGTGVLSHAQVAPEILRAYWIVTSCESAEWKNFKSPNDFTIGVYGFMAEEINSLNEIAAERKINDRNLVIKHFRKLKDITPTDVLFVNNHYNEELEQLYSIAVANKSLLMTDHAPSDRYFMINLLLEGKEKEYEINAENAAVADITFSEKMSNQGGSTLDLREMYVKKDKELKIKEEQLKVQKAQLDEKEKELKRQIEENRIITEQNRQLADELNKTEEEIEVQKTKAAILMDQVRDQQAKLAQNQLKLTEQEHEINSKQQQIESSNSELREKESQLTEREAKIREQESTIRVRNTAIDQNSTVITGIIIFIGVIVFL